MRLFVAMVLGSMVGIERERNDKAAGMRTHAVVCVGAALIMIVSTYGFDLGPNSEVLDPSRIAAQVVSGIGFLGAGVIIFRKNVVRGLTTAASVWAVSGVGLAAGGGLLLTALLGALFLLLIQAGLRPLKRRLIPSESRFHRITVHTPHDSRGLDMIRNIATGKPGFALASIDMESDVEDFLDRIKMTIAVKKSDDIVDVVQQLKALESVVRVEWQHQASSRSLGSGIFRSDPDAE